jgi:mannose-6-phosphate isomerase
MTDPLAYPLRFAPVHKSYIWGGDRIAKRYGRRGLPDACGESWEISAHPDGCGKLLNGPCAGATLAELARRHGRDLLGTAAPTADRFPLLFKIIDARSSLSVQVHPTAEAARRLGSECKNECWHLLAADPAARLYAGLVPGTTPRTLRAALDAGTADALLVPHPAAAGQTLYIPSGLVHAIGAGCLIYEVQQNANTTYRLYDWNRVDAAGRPRQLHIDEALASIDWTLPPPALDSAAAAPNTWRTHCATPFFTLRGMCLDRPCDWPGDARSFRVLFVAAGACDVTVGTQSEHLTAGTSCLIPACATACRLTPGASPARLLATTL